MDIEEIMKECERLFPKGTVFKSLTSGKVHISDGKARKINEDEISMWVNDDTIYASARVYKKEKWARPLSTPRSKLLLLTKTN